jgi:hypothetical protein
MRWIAAGIAATAWAPAAWALDVSNTTATLTGTTIALAAFTTGLIVNALRPTSAWLHAGAFYATVVQVAAASAAVATLPDRDLLIVVLLALSAESVAFGVLVGRPYFYLVSPIPACAAWLLYARDALAGDANWFTVPIGLTVLVIVGLLRWIRRGRGGNPAGVEVIVLEFVGMSFLIGSPLARTLSGHLWNGLLAIVIAVLIAAWGVITRVRWRAGFGTVGAVLATILLIGVPLSTSVTWTGPALWITLSAAGIAAIIAATSIERNRDHLRQMARRLDEMTADWERIPPRSGGPESGPRPDAATRADADPADDSTQSMSL